jgi:hypothetical protein
MKQTYLYLWYPDSTKKLSETDIMNIVESLIDNILVIGRVIQQTVGMYIVYKLCHSFRRRGPWYVYMQLLSSISGHYFLVHDI